MKIYLTVRILNFVDSDSVAMVGLFKYSIIGLLQSRASIIITSVAVLERLNISIKIPFVAFRSSGSTQESSSAFEFSLQGNLCYLDLRELLPQLFNQSVVSFESGILYFIFHRIVYDLKHELDRIFKFLIVRSYQQYSCSYTFL